MTRKRLPRAITYISPTSLLSSSSCALRIFVKNDDDDMLLIYIAWIA
jgi:hypothetical protein